MWIVASQLPSSYTEILIHTLSLDGSKSYICKGFYAPIAKCYMELGVLHPSGMEQEMRRLNGSDNFIATHWTSLPAAPK